MGDNDTHLWAPSKICLCCFLLHCRTQRKINTERAAVSKLSTVHASSAPPVSCQIMLAVLVVYLCSCQSAYYLFCSCSCCLPARLPANQSVCKPFAFTVSSFKVVRLHLPVCLHLGPPACASYTKREGNKPEREQTESLQAPQPRNINAPFKKRLII